MPTPPSNFDPFAGLPAPVFFDSNPTVLAQAFIIGYEAGYQAFSGVPLTLGQADPRYYEQLYNAFLVSQTYSNANLVAYQNLLRYATGSNLDVLGSFWGTLGLRLNVVNGAGGQSIGATVTILFSISAPALVPIPIPIGTLVAASSGVSAIAFATTAVGVIQVNSTSVSVSAQCTTTGDAGNGFIPGEITNLLNWSSPYVVSASNTTTSGGGANAETDDAFRIRLWMAPRALSTCGTQEGYEYFALSANSSITQVSAWSNPGISGTVVINALVGDEPAGEEVNAQILAACNPLNNRPLADQVIVTSPSGVPYSISVSYYIPQALSANIVDLQSGVLTAVSAFQTKTSSLIGSYIDPSQLETAIVDLGCIGVNVIEPIFYACQPWEWPQLTDDPIITYNGLI